MCALCLCGIAPLSLSAQAPSERPATRPSFSEWLAGVRADALERGIRAEIVDEALATVEEPEPTVIERDRAQAEAVFSLEKYIVRQLKPKLQPRKFQPLLNLPRNQLPSRSLKLNQPKPTLQHNKILL